MKDNILALLCALALAKADPVRTYLAYNEPEQAQIICAAANSDGILVAHENCNQFYQCWDGKPIARYCYGTLQYNPITEICDWPNSVDCGGRSENDHVDNEVSGNGNGGSDNGSNGAGNCDPSQAEAICAKEESDGILVAHENCNKYYICDCGIPVVRKCPGDLLFNINTDHCDWPHSVDCGNRIISEDSDEDTSNNGDSGNGNTELENNNTGAGNCDPSQAENICAGEGSNGVLVAHEKCNKYYICSHGVPVVQRCPGTLLFDPFKDYCDWPENVDCGDRVISEESEEDSNDGTGNESNGNDNGDSGNGSNVGSGAGNCDPSQAGNICASEGADGTLVAHENCNKYYICNHGVPVVQRCPGTLLFDPFKDYCDWPENVDCGDRVISEESEEDSNDGTGNENNGNDNGDSGNGSNVGSGAGNCDPSQAGNICASEGSDGTLVAHESCNKYYICNHGVPVVQRCPGTLLFDPFKDYCDWPENVDCGDRVISEESEEDSNDGTGNESNGNDNGDSGNGSNVGSGAGNCDPSQAGNICASEGSDGTLVAHESCNKYYICNHGVPVVQRCPGTLLFDPFKDYCDWPENVDCGDRVISEESEEDSNDGTGNESNGNDKGDSGNGSNVGSGAGNCDPSQAGNICASEGSDGTLVAHESCNKYYICNHGVPVVQRCPGTLLFDPFKDYCDWPENVDCGDRVISEESEEDSNDGTGNESNGNNNGDSGNDSNVGSGAGNCDPSQAGNICASEGADGTLVAHENCNKYYICNHGVPVVQRCPGTLLFDPFKDYCDWPENVDCGDRVISEESEEDSNDGTGNESNGNDNGDSGNGSNVGSGAGNCDPSQAGNICASEGSDGTLVAHESCNKYYICNHGVPVVQRCPGTLLFDPFKDYCDWPENVDCGDRVISEESEEDSNDGTGNESNGNDNGDSGNGSNVGSGAGNCDPSQAGNICASEGSDGTLVAHESCNKYYICNHGVPVVQRCPDTLLFDPFKDYCDWPENVDCGDRVISEENEEENNGNGESDNGVTEVGGSDNGGSGNGGSDNGGTDNGGSDNGGSGTCNCNPGEAPTICAADGSDGTFVAHENCNQFYTCAAGQPVTISCPGTTLYNPYTQQCDWPDNVDCGDRVIAQPESEEENNGNDNGGSEVGGSDNGGSGNGGSDNGGTDNGGSDNGGSGTCNCNPGEAPTICAADGSNGVLIPHENCNQFYTCAAGQPVTMTCPGTTLYNPYTQQCDWPENVECGDRVTVQPESEEENNGNGENDNGGTEVESPDNGESDNGGSDNGGSGNGGSDNGGSDNGGSDNGGSDNGGSGTCNCNPGEAPTICAADGSNGVLIAHENCNQFYTCAAGQPVTMTCPGTTLYNPYTQQCDWPENVECGDRVTVQPESEEENNGNGGNDNGGTEIESPDNGGSDNGGSDNGGSGNGGSDNGGSGTCNCNPGEAPTICAADGSNGVLIAHENCNQFYTCAAGQPVTMTCPGTTLYNPYTQQCDWPENVECGDRVTVQPESEEENNGNGGNDNGGTEIESPDNGESDNGGSDNGGSGNGGSDNGGSDNGGSGTCNCNPGEAPTICAADGSNGVLIAHENCNQFYTCAAGQPVTMTCPGTTLYNPYTQQCDWPENVECGDRVTVQPESEEENNGNGGNDNGGTEIESPDNGESDNGESDNGGSGNGGSDNGGSGTCNCNPGEAPTICAADGSNGVLIAHENCNQFYTCAAGQPVTMTCPGTTLYNPYTQQCDWPENVECGDRVTVQPESEEENNGNGENDNGGTEVESPDNGESDNGGSDNGGSGNGGSDNGGSGTCNCNPGEAPTICAADGSNGVLIAHENCNQFYTCAAGQPVTMTCPGTTLYNPYTQQCDWPENVECGDRVTVQPESEEENNGNGGNDNGGTEIESPDNGESDNGGSDNGGSDNGGSGTCNCNPGEAPTICAADGSNGVLIAHENCNQFYTCAAGQPVTMTCPGTTLYNPYTQQCDWPENVECGDRVTVQPESEEENNGNGGNDNGGTEVESPDNGESDNGGSDNGGSGNGGSDNGGSDNGGSGTCNCNPGEAPTICAADGSNGVLIAHENCNQFYTCAAGQPVTMTCPGTTLYNPYTQQCDWPENVECGDRVTVQPESEEENNGNGGNDNGGTEIESPDNGESDNGESDNGGSGNGGSDNGGSGTCNCNPGEAPTICAADGSNGVLIAHENCNQFYTCTAGQPVTMTCPGTTLYNPYTQQCDWPENVSCGERIIPEDCDEDSDNDNSASENESSGNGDSDNGGSDNGGSGICNCNPAEAPTICVADGSNGVLVAHENCNQFYTCVAGQPVTMTCAGSTLYNPYTQVCDWPENVSCGERVIPEDCDEDSNNDNDNSDSGNGDSDNGGDGPCNCNPAEAPAICAADGSEGSFVSHENCNQFYTCVAGQPVTMTCADITLYNPYTQTCDWPENVECGERVIPEDCDEDNNNDNDNNGSENEGSGNGDSDNGGDGTCNCNPAEAPAICAADGSEGLFVAHENCNQFYTCVAGQPVTLTCSGSTLYNPYTQVCDWPENVSCGERVIPEDCDEDSNNDNDNNGSESEGSGNGDSDNGGDGTCNCNPAEAPAICAADGSEGSYVAHKNCNQFYTCVAGQPVTLTCASTTLYNPYTQVCDWPENVSCGDRIITEDVDTASTDNNGGGEESVNEDENKIEDADNNTPDVSTTCAASDSEGVALPHENCKQYYACVGGQPVVMQCSGILLFNDKAKHCDWPDNVDCGNRII